MIAFIWSYNTDRNLLYRFCQKADSSTTMTELVLWETSCAKTSYPPSMTAIEPLDILQHGGSRAIPPEGKLSSGYHDVRMLTSSTGTERSTLV